MRALRPPMPQGRFAHHGGMHCPVCRSVNTDNGCLERTHGACTKFEAACLDCGAKWLLYARVTGYRLIEETRSSLLGRARRLLRHGHALHNRTVLAAHRHFGD